MDIDVALETCREAIRKKRIRIHDFFVDFDPLRSGLVHPHQFITALGISGVDKAMTESQLISLKSYYNVKRDDGRHGIDYRAFCQAMNAKGSDELAKEKSPILTALTRDQDARLITILSTIGKTCLLRGILLKPMFADFANSVKSTKLVGHVTRSQFHRTIDAKLGIELPDEDVEILCLKYADTDYTEMVNYVEFSHDVIPDETPYNPYTDV